HLEFLLADGIWPKFGLSVKGLKLTAKDPCVSQSQLTVSEVYLPIRLSSLFSKNVSFSDIQADVVKFHYMDPVCNSSFDKSSSLSPPHPHEDETYRVEEHGIHLIGSLRDFVENRFVKELTNSRQWFYTLNFKKLYLLKGEGEEEGLLLDNFLMDLNKFEQKVVILTQLSYLSPKYTIDELRPVDLEFVLSQENLQLQGQGRFKEGELSLRGSLDIPTEEFKMHFESNYFPVGEIIKSINAVKGITQGINPRLLWFSCKASAEGMVGDYKNIQVKASQCGVRGESGKLFTNEIIFYPFLKKPIEPFTAEVEKFSLRYLSEIMGGSKLESTFTSWGHLDGQLEFNNEQLRFIGSLNNIEAIFSQMGKKRLQHIREARGEVVWQDDRVSGIINEIDITGGEFLGVISFNMDERFRSGVLQAKIDKVILSRPVMRLYLELEPSPFEIFGKMSFKNGELEEWQGIIGVPQLSFNHIAAKKLKLETKYSGHIWDLGVKLTELNIESESAAFARLKQLLIIEKEVDNFNFKKLHAVVQIFQEGGEWKEASAREENLNILMSSAGKWSSAHQILGWLNVEKRKKKWMPWELAGTWNQIEFSPSIQLLKAIRPTNSTIKLENKMSAQLRREAFDKIMDRRKGLPLKGFTEKVVDTAKKWIPDFSDKRKASEVKKNNSSK
ncbi:MAG: hypothetical protein KDD40_03725, partial [Bdellovibrionales bacterium]|nr:hypothetical protein [Bdellovibrionales bacterium]